jgi:hypothetical protein
MKVATQLKSFFKPLKKSLAGTNKRRPDLPAKTGAAAALKTEELKDAMSHPRQNSSAKSSGSALERRFVSKDGLWPNDRESMLSAISAQFARHGAKDALPVYANGRTTMLSSSMVLEQLQLFVSTSPASGPAPSSLSTLMHASLQLWQDASHAAKDGKRQPPFMRELNDKVDDGIKAAGKYPLNVIPAKTGKIAAKPITADTNPVAVQVPPRALARRFERTADGTTRKADLRHNEQLQPKTQQDGERQPPFMHELKHKVDDGITAAGEYPLNVIPAKAGKIAAEPILAEPVAVEVPAAEGYPLNVIPAKAEKIAAKRIPDDTNPVAVQVPPPALARRFERTADRTPRKADLRHKEQLQPKTQQALSQQKPMPFQPGLLKMGVMIDLDQAPDTDTLNSLVRGAQDDKVIAALPVEGGRLLLMKVSREPQFEADIRLAARKINEHPLLAGKCATDCVSVGDLRALMDQYL